MGETAAHRKQIDEKRSTDVHVEEEERWSIISRKDHKIGSAISLQISRDFGRDHAYDARILIYQSPRLRLKLHAGVSSLSYHVQNHASKTDWCDFEGLCVSKSMSMHEKSQDRRNIHDHNIPGRNPGFPLRESRSTLPTSTRGSDLYTWL